ncbi:uncharacterized protein KD926_002515 [Aspergillus affinis]|uniref:uncharacterized protein n=1 Tax=Aspergillus affinis TaxID=1070780 RepID=UPI0022FDEFA4|nr:uncharacterized protein KD926_002515 [Aspergillus affinis]KAI9036036.1 hypothetical protein KD926_002515 [Aspergillus affinis]
MAPIQSALSETLRSLTQSKIRDLEKRQHSYESDISSLLDDANSVTDSLDKLAHLLAGVKDLLPQTDRDDPEITNIEHCLSQARYGSSIPFEKLVSIRDQLVSRLDIISRRLNLADLYTRLLIEWVNNDGESNKSPVEPLPMKTTIPSLKRNRSSASKTSATNLKMWFFEPLETRPAEIRAFLEDLFPDEETKNELEVVRAGLRQECIDLWDENSTGEGVFNTGSLTLCIKALLKEDILSDSKKEMLKDFLDNRNWERHAGDNGIPVLPTQQLNGKYRIWMDYDVLQTIFIQHIGSERTLAEYGRSYDKEDEDAKPSNQEENKNVKQHLLRKVATETLLHRALHGEAAAIQSDLKWYGTSLSHSTIFTIMEFVGFPQRWITFFRKYLESPLNMDQSCSGREPRGSRTRKRGLPIAHASEKLLGELVLFFMDLAVNRQTGMLLYRLYDDLWICGEPGKCAQAWEVMHKFADVTGLEFNVFKTGSVYLSDSRDLAVQARLPKGPVTIGFLTLDPESGVWKNRPIPSQRAPEPAPESTPKLRHNFGQPAYYFERPHVDEILETYEKVNRILFGFRSSNNGSTLTEYLRQMIKSRFAVSDVPDAFLFLPEELGGLGLKNPFIPVLLVRDSIATSKSPAEQIQLLHDNLRSTYASRKKEFENLTDDDRHERLEGQKLDSEQEAKHVLDPSMFMSFDEYMQYPDTRNTQVADFYKTSTQVAAPAEIKPTPEYSQGLSKAQ